MLPKTATIRKHQREDAKKKLAHHFANGFRPLVHGKNRSQGRVQVAPADGVKCIEDGQKEARDNGGSEQFRNRRADHRAHDHQHDARRNQHSQRAAGSDGTGIEPCAISAFHHDRRRHDAEDGDCGANDPGRRGEQGSHRQNHDVERSLYRGQQKLKSMKQAVHEAGPLKDVSHEQEQRHRSQKRLGHGAEHLIGHQVKNHLAEPDIAEHDAQEYQGERDGKADEDENEQGGKGHEAQVFRAHVHRPCLMASTHLSDSERPCIIRRVAVSGITVLNG